MEPELDSVLSSFPNDWFEKEGGARSGPEVLELFSQAPTPTGRLPRAFVLGSLQARICLAFGWNWFTSGLKDGSERERLRREAKAKAAVKLLGGMGYLRGAVMKLGQMLACYPEVLPDEFVETLSGLHFEAPPMHFALLREHVRKELGADPEEIFASFETRAFAAASLGQVHRARLLSGEPVAVKIQYPNIARTIRDDLANLQAVLKPLCRGRDGENLIEQLADVRETLIAETDYVREAQNAERVRNALADMQDVVVPRVHHELSTARVLTMELMGGQHPSEFMAQNPPQELRDRRASQVVRATARLWCSDRLILADPNPGNFLFLEDGRLGLVDFGCARSISDEEWGCLLSGVRAIRNGGDDELEAIRCCAMLNERELKDARRVNLIRAACEWFWEPMRTPGLFDSSDGEYLRRGLSIFAEQIKERYTRQVPVFNWVNRMMYGVRALAYQLRARVPFSQIHREELERAGV